MKRTVAAVLGLMLVLSIAGCGTKSAGNDLPAAGGADAPSGAEAVDTEQTQDAVIENGEISQEAAVLKEPPALTVEYGESGFEALRGTASWRYQINDAAWTGIEADSMHPLTAKEYMPYFANPAPSTVRLQWETAPDEVSVRCWNEEDWGRPDAESEELPVNTLMVDSNTATVPITSIELKGGSYIYEVIAEWNRSEKYNGIARYSFYTVK